MVEVHSYNRIRGLAEKMPDKMANILDQLSLALLVIDEEFPTEKIEKLSK